MSSQPTVLVLGAQGRFGQVAVQTFAAAGWHVLAQSRRAQLTPSPANVSPIVCDALDVTTIVQSAAGAGVVINALNPVYTEWEQQVPPLAAAALAIARGLGARLMVPGNVYNFGRALPEALTEDTPFEPSTSKACVRIDLEAHLQSVAAQGVRSVVIRAGDFLGGPGTWFDLVIGKSLAQGKWVEPGPDDIAHAWAWLPDLAATFVQVAAVERHLPNAAVLHYAGLTLTLSELRRAVEAALGHSLVRSTMPWLIIGLAAWVAPMPRALVEMRYLWQRPHRLVDDRLRQWIGRPPQTPLNEIAQALVAQRPS